MTVNVNGYVRHQNGHLVSVHGYDANGRDYAEPDPLKPGVRSQPETTKRQSMGISPPGVHPLAINDQSSMVAGITTYQVRLLRPPKTVVRWRRSILPIHGAYKIPKKPGG